MNQVCEGTATKFASEEEARRNCPEYCYLEFCEPCKAYHVIQIARDATPDNVPYAGENPPNLNEENLLDEARDVLAEAEERGDLD